MKLRRAAITIFIRRFNTKSLNLKQINHSRLHSLSCSMRKETRWRWWTVLIQNNMFITTVWSRSALFIYYSHKLVYNRIRRGILIWWSEPTLFRNANLFVFTWTGSVKIYSEYGYFTRQINTLLTNKEKIRYEQDRSRSINDHYIVRGL